MIRTRFAPSPTGYLHVGGARTALFCWAYARRHQGQFILRIEDTDLARSTKEATDAIFDSMKWLGLDWDEGPYFQMQRLQRYKDVADKLLDEGNAYWCYASPEELEEMRESQRSQGIKQRTIMLIVVMRMGICMRRRLRVASEGCQATKARVQERL